MTNLRCLLCVYRNECWTNDSCDRYEKDKTLTEEQIEDFKDIARKMSVMFHSKIITKYEDGTVVEQQGLF